MQVARALLHGRAASGALDEPPRTPRWGVQQACHCCQVVRDPSARTAPAPNPLWRRSAPVRSNERRRHVSREASSAGPTRTHRGGREARAGDPQCAEETKTAGGGAQIPVRICLQRAHTYLSNVISKQIVCFVLIDIRSITLIVRTTFDSWNCGFDVICLKLIFALNRRVSVVR